MPPVRRRPSDRLVCREHACNGEQGRGLWCCAPLLLSASRPTYPSLRSSRALACIAARGGQSRPRSVGSGEGMQNAPGAVRGREAPLAAAIASLGSREQVECQQVNTSCAPRRARARGAARGGQGGRGAGGRGRSRAYGARRGRQHQPGRQRDRQLLDIRLQPAQQPVRQVGRSLKPRHSALTGAGV